MITPAIRDTIRSYLEEDFEESRKNVYFEQYHSSKELTKTRISNLVAELVVDNELNISPPTSLDGNGLELRIESEPVLFWELSNDRWLIVYSTALKKSYRKKLSDLDSRVGWLLESWFRSEIVDNIFHEYSPEEESVDIERKWDPYHIYKSTSDIPENLQNYYEDNLRDFVEQEIEFNLKTPQWMVDDALEEGIEQELLNKSEITETRFTYSGETRVLQDGGTATESPNSTVTLRKSGQTIHNKGQPDATMDLLEELDRRNTIEEELEEVLPKQDLEIVDEDSGIRKISDYRPAKVLKVSFTHREYDESASITLRNLLTVGHNDVDLHGNILEEGDLWFYAKTHTVYDSGEYEVLFLDDDDVDRHEPDLNPRATVYIKPNSGTEPSLKYILRKLLEKFDPRAEYEIIENFPYERAAEQIETDNGGEE
jgi:hypothetical protein